MRIRLLQQRVGPGIDDAAGAVVDVDPEDAARMITAGVAEPIRDPLKEKAVGRRGERRSKR